MSTKGRETMDFDYKCAYQKIQKEYLQYRLNIENFIKRVSDKNLQLEKQLNVLANIVEIVSYVNSNCTDDNFLSLINDMIIGIFGCSYSCICLIFDKNVIIKSNNSNKECDLLLKKNIDEALKNNKSISFKSVYGKEDIGSIIYEPIYINNSLKGYIIIGHKKGNYFVKDQICFAKDIAKQLGTALGNNYSYKQLKEKSIRDSLIKQIYTREYFFQVLDNILKNDPGNAFAIVMIDLDDFKSINDNYGHQFGDEVLKRTGKIIANNIDKKDIVARYGGEEIIIYINKVENSSEVIKKMETIRRNIESECIKYNNISKTITASFGIAYYPRDGKTLEEVIGYADNMLYKAKSNGKNLVVSSF